MRVDHLDVAQRRHHGTTVAVNVPMDALRRHQCLCLNCGRMSGECTMADTLYACCKLNQVALMVTRCPQWEAREDE